MQTRVAFAKCESYRPEEISASLEKLFSSLGGLGQFISPGNSVLIKPNLLTDRAPEKAVTTHPEVARALIHMIRQCGGKPFIGDSPAGTHKIESILKKTGFRALCEDEKVTFLVLEKEPSISHNYHGTTLAISRPALEADVIVNVPKLKTHSFTMFTNAVKNVFGLLPGYQKALLHKTFPTPDQFGGCLAFLYSKIRPELTVCDAITAMEGDGPSAGSPVNLGFLAASADGVALDRILCQMLKIDFNEVRYFEALKQINIGETDLKNIDLTGDYQQLAGLNPLRLPVTAKIIRFIPRGLVRLIGPYVWIRPSFNEKCTLCGRCIQTCPVKALVMPDSGRVNHPFLDNKKCIGCCCCHEICPEGAIKMTCSPLLCLTSMRRLRRKNETPD